MFGRKQLILITCATLALLGAWAIVSATRDREGPTLITQLFEIAGPPEVRAQVPEEKAEPAPQKPSVKAIEGLPSEVPLEKYIDQLMSAGLPSGLSEPYYGTWSEQSVSEESIATIKTSLHRDGTVEISAVLKPRDTSQRAQRLGASGRWAMDGADIVIVIDRTDSPETLAVGFLQVFGNSRVSGPDWTYTDTDGTSRVMRKR